MAKLGFPKLDKTFKAQKKSRAKARKAAKKESGKNYKNIFKA